MSQIDASVLAALKQAVERDSTNAALWLHYADLLMQARRTDDAVAAYKAALAAGADQDSVSKRLIPLLRATGALAEALIRAERMLEKEDNVEIRLELARVLDARGDREGAVREYETVIALRPDLRDPGLDELRSKLGSSVGSGPGAETHETSSQPPTNAASSPGGSAGDAALADVVPERLAPDSWVEQFDWDDMQVTFASVAGLDDVKNQIQLRIIAPFKDPAIYRAFKRTAGGGILLYGPPGCGKTFIARATAGECGARFVSVGIHEVVDRYWGESEKYIHALFQEARRKTPTVLFFDEFDALGSKRTHAGSEFWKTLVDQLLHEMDGLEGRNGEILLFASTNAPWNVDSAFRRPGRFDRVMLVPPPDEKARGEMLRKHIRKLPGADAIDVALLARETALMTGADLRSLCERASERALSESLVSRQVHPVTMEDLHEELRKMNSSATEWLATARNYARYANEGGQYADLVNYLKSVRMW